MILYNVTVSIDPSIHEEWLEWMKAKHIPDVMSTGCFVEARISRVHGEEENGMTFAMSASGTHRPISENTRACSSTRALCEI
jgi:hypothetical protein